MLYVTLFGTGPGNTFQEGVGRRLQWSYPESANALAEYWLKTESPRVVAVVETESKGVGEYVSARLAHLFTRSAPRVAARLATARRRRYRKGRAQRR